MKKKGMLLITAVAATFILAGCHHRQPMPQGSKEYQSGCSEKLGGACHCKHHKRHCKDGG